MSGLLASVGIVAGGGSLPLEVAESVARRGAALHVVMVEGAADEALAAYPHTRVNWAGLGKACDAFERAKIRDVVLLGTYTRPNFRSARPDLTFLKVLPSVVSLLRAGGDDAVLRGVIGVFEGRGLRVHGVAGAAPELIVAAGPLTPERATGSDRRDIDLGFSVIAALGRFDIGQAVVVADGHILAIEGAEGTDRMLQRVSQMRSGQKQRSGVLVKCPKPGQDLRIDLPAIGPNTVLNAEAARLAGVAVLADHVLAAERAKLAEAATKAGIFVEGVSFTNTAVAEPAVAFNVKPIGRRALDAIAVRETQRGAEILATLSRFKAGTAVVIRKKRVLSIGAQETAENVIGRITAKRRSKRQGVAVVRSPATGHDDILRSAADAGLAAVAFDAPPPQSAVAVADSLDLIIAVVSRRPT